MPILVVCPGCHGRFHVSEKFAGKQGACPKCRASIKVPELSEQVVIQGATEPAKSGSAGQLTIKPIAREPARFKPLWAVGITASALAVLAVCWLAGPILRGPDMPAPILRAIGLLLVTPPLVIGGYIVLRNQELLAYFGRAYWTRVGICTAAYVGLWVVFYFVYGRIDMGSPWQLAVTMVSLVIVGALTSLATFDFDFGTATLHCGFYFLVTMVLGWLTGMGWPWNYLT